jgi:hypothetical protein
MLHIGVSSWIIQDGNYDDFTVGQRAEFALEFGVLDVLRPASKGPVEAQLIGEARYRIRARVVFVASGVWVIDAGSFMAYREQWSTNDAPQAGDLVEGGVYVGIDPFFYFEGLHKLPGMPSLTYPWLVRGILLETTPWIEARDERGRLLRTRDTTRESFATAATTNAWHDDGGYGHYVLLCEMTGEGVRTPNTVGRTFPRG